MRGAITRIAPGSALAYASGLQNKDEADAENFGAFGYESNCVRGSVTTNRVAGARTLRGYGSMIYAGLESMIYAQVGREDPRVRCPRCTARGRLIFTVLDVSCGGEGCRRGRRSRRV